MDPAKSQSLLEGDRESRDEATQRGMEELYRSRDNVKANESYFVLNPAADW